MPAVQLKEAPPAISAPAASSARLVSLDVLSGLTVAGMILVTDPGTYSAIFSALRHAAWQGATPTDMIFPSFLFMVGVSIVFSTHARFQHGATPAKLVSRVLRRTVLLIVFGLLVNGFPFYDLHNLRFPGILQRIALCYAAAALLYLWITHPGFTEAAPRGNQQRPISTVALLAGIIAVILVSYYALLRFASVPGFGPARYDSLGYLGA